jgi:1-deoxy-D-xylulose 5-phosphate reductoisomerase
MSLDIASLGSQIGTSILASLKSDSGKVKAMALAEGDKLALALSQIAALLAQRQIDGEEAALLVRVQKDASEAVLASLAEISRVAASKAVLLGLQGVASAVDSASGVPILGPLFVAATALATAPATT